MSHSAPLHNLSIPDAKKRRWEIGLQHYRKDPTEKFVGVPLQELYAELIDALNYLDEAGRQHGDTTAGRLWLVEKSLLHCCETVAHEINITTTFPKS